MKLYLAGPMRGYPDDNRAAFKIAANRLREAGHFVFNPAEIMVDGLPLRQCMGIDLAWICSHAEGIALLPGWEPSLGATAEVAAARAIGIASMPYDYFLSKGDR